MQKITFLHIADLHMGMRLGRFEKSVAHKLRESRLQALGRALQGARDNAADFIVMAGDLFDDNTVELVLAQRVLDAVNNAGIAVYVIPGNHDPNRPGSVWQRHMSAAQGCLHPMLERAPVHINENTVLLPCPVERKISAQDPTAWIPARAPGDESIRIAVAHGSVMDRANLPLDDHPIPVDCATLRYVDYVALGHWHNHKIYTDASGVARMAYPGTHEQMGFAKDAVFGTGWQAYASDPSMDELQSSTRGCSLLVTITRGAGRSAVNIKQLDTGNFTWAGEQHKDLDDQALAALLASLEQRDNPEKTLLRLKLHGLVSLDSITAQEAVQDLLQRFVFHELDTSGLHIKPGAGDMARALGSGILPRIFDRLADRESRDPQQDAVHDAALNVLYKLCREAAQ
jgi:predicted phosphodiesterase